MPMPDIDLINQLLKLSETDKDMGIKHLISLFKTVSGTVDKSSPQLCKDFVEDYLSKPYIVYHPKESHKLVTKRELEGFKKSNDAN